MTDTLFICYPAPEENIAEKLRDELQDLGVPAWVYSIDRTAGRHNWEEIEVRIRTSRAVLVIVSDASVKSEGQRRELELARDAIRGTNPGLLIVPLAIDGEFRCLPTWLQGINGFAIHRAHISTVACTLAEQLFAELIEERCKAPWRYPRPGEWLTVIAVDECTDQDFQVGDEVYFRRISPMGFFECFCPQIDDLFWFYSRNLGVGPGFDRGRDGGIPDQYVAMRQFGA